MYISTYKALMASLRVTLTPPEFVENVEANKFQDKLVEDLQRKFEEIMQGVSKNIMREMDKNVDGKLTKDEFCEFILANPFVKASYQLKFTKDGGQPTYQDDGLYLKIIFLYLFYFPYLLFSEKVTREVLLSFLSTKSNSDTSAIQ